MFSVSRFPHETQIVIWSCLCMGKVHISQMLCPRVCDQCMIVIGARSRSHTCLQESSSSTTASDRVHGYQEDNVCEPVPRWEAYLPRTSVCPLHRSSLMRCHEDRWIGCSHLPAKSSNLQTLVCGHHGNYGAGYEALNSCWTEYSSRQSST